MSTRIVRTGPIAPVARGAQPPPSLPIRVGHSTLIVTGLVRSGAGRGRRFRVDDVLKGDPNEVDELPTVDLPPFPDGEHQIVMLLARDSAGALRLTADPRDLDPSRVAAILAAMPSETNAGG